MILVDWAPFKLQQQPFLQASIKRDLGFYYKFLIAHALAKASC